MELLGRKRKEGKEGSIRFRRGKGAEGEEELEGKHYKLKEKTITRNVRHDKHMKGKQDRKGYIWILGKGKRRGEGGQSWLEEKEKRKLGVQTKRNKKIISIYTEKKGGSIKFWSREKARKCWRYL